MNINSFDRGADGAKRGAWSAVFALAFGVAGLITTEFLPMSLLTPMSQGLGVSEGLAGQSLTATAFAAIFTSLLIGSVARGIDRRSVFLAFMAIMIASNAAVALAPSFGWLLLARVALGAALGGFWALAASVAMRLVPKPDVPKALSIVFGGVSVSMVISAPLGTMLGELLGWRGVFVAAALVAVAGFAWLWISLPSMPAENSAGRSGIRDVGARRDVRMAMIAIFTVFCGQFAFFSYARPFYERVTQLDVQTLSVVLLAFGIANFIGTSISSPALRRRLMTTLWTVPAVLMCCAAALALAGAHTPAATAITALWGFAFGFVPVGWSTWITRHVQDDPESAGGLQVAVIQVANTVGAAAGGYALDHAGAGAPVTIAAVLFAITVFVAKRMGSMTLAAKSRAVAAPAE